jgi:hypothetical protein
MAKSNLSNKSNSASAQDRAHNQGSGIGAQRLTGTKARKKKKY